MVQVYGTSESHRNVPQEPEDAYNNENTALLGHIDSIPAVSRIKSDGPAGLTSSVSNLANTIIGSGMSL